MLDGYTVSTSLVKFGKNTENFEPDDISDTSGEESRDELGRS